MLPLFATTMFLSALLLFSVQPMFTKFVLPLLGGSPAVWNTAMVFFQATLLAGYFYAHASTRLVGPKRQPLLHMAMLATAFVALPVGVAAGWTPPAERMPVLWMIGLLTVSLGLPFFAVSTTAPLLQKWFAHSGHAAGEDPYFLYAASNLGSMLALLSYPIVIEPFLRLGQQTWAWTLGYTVLVILIATCGFFVWRSEMPDAPKAPAHAAGPDEPIPWRRRVHWTLLAFAPSSLLLGVTTHLTTDVAAVPLLWVIPLATYLLTFVIVFSRKPILKHHWMVKAQPFFIIPLIMTFYWSADLFYWHNAGLWVFFPLHLLTFFLTAMVCHGELVRLRPSVSHLTEFYLWMSIGGVLGGAFNALAGPLLFDSVMEYPLVLVLACLLRPGERERELQILGFDVVLPAVLVTALVVPALAVEASPSSFGLVGIIPLYAVAGLCVYSFTSRPLRFGLGIGGLLLASAVFPATTTPSAEVLARERSFFGVHKVTIRHTGPFRVLMHGTTVHGAQHVNPTRWHEPLGYYHRAGPLGQLFGALDGSPRFKQVGVVGLGTGTVACYRQPGQEWTFYEIDPVVEQLARDTRYFHYMSECAGEAPVVLGDARLTLRKAPDRHYDLLILDAFSSDAIPVHLITREAMQLYFAKLADRGILMFHVSNRALDLTSVLGNLAADAGLVGRVQTYKPRDQEDRTQFKLGSVWVALARRPEALAVLDGGRNWLPLEPRPGAGIWTDDFSNIIGALRWWQPSRDTNGSP